VGNEGFYMTYFMEQSTSWEANSHTTSQEIFCLSWNLKVHYHVHELTTGLCPEPDESIPQLSYPISLRSISLQIMYCWC
jgi:hypothetical protein